MCSLSVRIAGDLGRGSADAEVPKELAQHAYMIIQRGRELRGFRGEYIMSEGQEATPFCLTMAGFQQRAGGGQ